MTRANGTRHLIARLKRIFNGLLGSPFEFHTARSLVAADWRNEDFDELNRLLNAGPACDVTVRLPYLKSRTGDRFAFPICSDLEFMGFAVVWTTKQASDKRLLLMAELLALIFEYALTRGEYADTLQLLAEKTTLMNALDGESNVRSFRPVSPLRPAETSVESLEWTPSDNMSQATAQDDRLAPLASFPLLIQARPDFPLVRVAIEIHHGSGRWAFVSFKDLPENLFSSRTSIEELGSMTLFIPDLTELSTEQQLKLAEYLATEPCGDKPHIIAGIKWNPQELVAGGHLLPHLLRSFCLSHLNWTGSGADSPSRETVRLSLRQIRDQTERSAARLRAGTVRAEPGNLIPFHLKDFDPDQPLKLH